MATVKINQIAMPPHYLREKIKTVYVNELLTDLALINGVEDWHELIPAKGKKIKVEWPFPPIEVARNEKQVLSPTEKGQKPSDVKKKLKTTKKYFPYELIDGIHRMTVARRIKMKELPATIKQITDPAERFLEQYKTNGGPRGLRLDKDDRDNAIRLMSKEFNISQKKLVEITGLDQTSISRIIAVKQRKEGPRKSSSKKDSSDDSVIATSSEKPSATMTPEGFLTRLQICCSELPKLKSGIVAELNQVANEKGLKLLIERVKEILDMLEYTHMKKFSTEKPVQEKIV